MLLLTRDQMAGVDSFFLLYENWS